MERPQLQTIFDHEEQSTIDMNEKERHWRYLEQIFAGANINQGIYTGSKLTVGNGTAEISFEVNDRFHHGMAALHGSVYFKLLDDAAYFAANSVVEDNFLVTTGFHIHLLRPVGAGLLLAKAGLKLKSKQLFIAESRLYDAHGKEIAFGTGHFAKSAKSINDHA